MSYKLKNRRNSIPNGFHFRQALTGWENDKVCPPSVWDFFLLCTELQKHRIANPKYKLATDLGAIQNEVDRVNAERVAAIPGSESYIVSTDTAQSFRVAPAPTALRKFVAAAKAISAGAETISDFIDSGESPVAQELAESRAAVCVRCPLNEKGDLSRFFTIPAAERIRRQIGMKEKRGLKTSLDEKLHVCSGCLCVNRLKVFFPLRFILNHMDTEIESKLDPKCWVLSEKHAIKQPNL